MPNMILLGRGGSLNPERVVAVASTQSTPIKRLLKQAEPNCVLDLTYGGPSRSVVLFDNGMFAVTSYPVDDITIAVRRGQEIIFDENLPF